MRWYLATALVLLAAVVLGLGWLAYAMYALAGVMVVSRGLARSWANHLAAKRECNRTTVNVGDTVAVLLSVGNTGRLSIPWVLVEDQLPAEALIERPPRIVVVGRRLQLVTLRGRQQKVLTYQLRFQERGYYQVGPVVLETGDLFGLYRCFRTVTEPHFVLVYPEVTPLEEYDVASRRPIGEVRLSHRLYEDPTRVAGVRAYQAGDPLHRIHWRASARTGTLHSKVYEPSSVAGATLLLDFHRAAFGERDVRFRSELAVRMAASLANALYQMGHQVGLVSNGRDAADRIRTEGWDPAPQTRRAARLSVAMRAKSTRLEPLIVSTQHGAEQLLRILETLARVELSDGLHLAQLVSETAHHMPRDATVIALVPSVGVEAAVALGNLRRRGLAVEAIVATGLTHEFEESAGRLAAEGIPARQLSTPSDIAPLCRAALRQ